MEVTVLVFARVRELLGAGARKMTLPAGAAARDVWAALADECTELRPLAGSTRIAVNGKIAAPAQPLADGDEVALLPPAGGG